MIGPDPGGDPVGNSEPLIGQQTCWRCGKQVDLGGNPCPYCSAELIRQSRDTDGPSTSSRSARSAGPLARTLIIYSLMLLTSVLVGFTLSGGDSTGASEERIEPRDVLIPIAAIEAVDTVLILIALGWIAVPRSRPPGWGRRLGAWCAFFPALALLLLLNFSYHGLLRETLDLQVIDQTMFTEGSLLPIWFVLLCVQPALIEEVFFRHVTYKALHDVMGLHSAVIISSIMFGLVHIAVPLSIPMLMVLGIGLGYARAVSGGIALPIVMHFIHNVAVLAFESRLLGGL